MSRRYSFGEFVLDGERRSLRRGEVRIELGARAFGVLHLLVLSAGRVVSRRELLDGVWGDVAVTDDSLARAISDLRAALGDDPARPRFIRTVHRQGYVLVAPVAPVEETPSSDADEGPPPGKRSRVPILVAAIALLVLASMWAVRQLTDSPGRRTGTGGSPFSTWTLRALGPSPFMSTAIKPAFAKSEDLLSVVAPDPVTGIHSIFLLRPDGGEPLQLTRDIEVRGPAPEFSPDDSHILFTNYRDHGDEGLAPDVWLVPVPAGEPVLLLEHASAASYRPDGRALVYSLVTAQGTSLRVRHEDGRDTEIAAVGFWPRWSPDGEWIAFTTSDPEGGDGTVDAVRPDGSDHRTLTQIAAQVYGLCWGKDSRHVIFASEQAGPMALWSVDVDTAEQVPVTWGPGISTVPTLSPDGKRLVFDFDHRRWHLYLAPAAGQPATRVLTEAGVTDASLSPDGSLVALVLGAAGQSSAVAVLDLATQRRRTLSGMDASSVAWMPTGRALLLAAAAPDGVHHWIWRIAVGGGLPEPVLGGETFWDDPAVSPDGKSLAAVRRTDAGHEIVVRDLDRGQDRVLARSVSFTSPRWSPDGRLLAWSGTHRPDDLTSGGIWVCPVPEGPPRRLSPDGAWPVWEEDGLSLLFVRFLENEGIWRVPISGATPGLVSRLEGEMRNLTAEGLDGGIVGKPLLILLSRFSGKPYILEAPDR